MGMRDINSVRLLSLSHKACGAAALRGRSPAFSRVPARRRGLQDEGGSKGCRVQCGFAQYHSESDVACLHSPALVLPLAGVLSR